MDPVVVSYFPGAGGFRFIHHWLGEPFDLMPNENYHYANLAEHLKFSELITHAADQYPTMSSHNVVLDQVPISYTHAINSDIIKRSHPGRKIIKIKSNLAHALIRYWNVEGFRHHQQAIKSIGLETVFGRVMKFHCDYYTQTGVDWEADRLIDLESDSDEFSVFMRDQLARAQLSDACRHFKNWQFTTRNIMAF
jgi:hypothetical protein